jgi:TonB family protein
MEVTDVLRNRVAAPAGFQRMVALSLMAHAALLAALLLAPGHWFSGREAEPRTIMTITLGGGTPGTANGGLTQMGGRPIQAETPPEAPKRPEPARPPAARTPEMTLPTPQAKPARPSTPTVKEAPPDARGRTPTRGAQTTTGSAIADTGVRGGGFGLSSGGGSGSGSYLDVGDFCCPEYLTTMIELIRRNWSERQEVSGETVVKFTIQRDGRISDVSVTKQSGYDLLDLAAQRAITGTRQLPPLPAAFTNPTLTVHLDFQYTR